MHSSEKRPRLDLEDEDKRLSRMRLAALLEDAAVAKVMQGASLRQLLLDVDASSDARDLIKKQMQSPVFLEFADACLAAVGEANGAS